MHYDQNNPLRILYVGRLVKEKGIDIILSALENLSHDPTMFGSIEWEICGDGEYRNIFEKLHLQNVHTHGHLYKKEIQLLQKKSHVSIVPSRFLETFGLSALESVSNGLPVIGFKKGGLVPYVHHDLALDEENPVDSLVQILQNIISGSIDLPKILDETDISPFFYDLWRQNLESLTKNAQKILLVNDYISKVGGAEIYTHSLKSELEKLGKQVEIYGYKKPISSLKRKVFFLFSFFAFWRWGSLRGEIQKFQPDLIWCQSTLRYIGIFGILAISQSSTRKYLTHHDLGLITPYPSKVYTEMSIPSDTSFGAFLGGSMSPFIACKYFYLKFYWKLLRGFDLMIVPSLFLEKHIGKYISESKIQTFSHTIFPD